MKTLFQILDPFLIGLIDKHGEQAQLVLYQDEDEEIHIVEMELSKQIRENNVTLEPE